MRKFTDISEAVKTPCQTEGANYKIEIGDDKVGVEVTLPFKLELSEDDAKLLEDNIHNAMELVLSKYFSEND